ncbi:MAG: hypothetical protein ACKVKM_13560 [Verrucomicrobiia bacterium]
MKLNNRQIAEVKNQMGAKPIPAKDPAVATFMERYGRHTFYLDLTGLHFFQLEQEQQVPDCQSAILVRIARWADESRESLLGHMPVRVLPDVKVILSLGREQQKAEGEVAPEPDTDQPNPMEERLAMQASARAAAKTEN